MVCVGKKSSSRSNCLRMCQHRIQTQWEGRRFGKSENTGTQVRHVLDMASERGQRWAGRGALERVWGRRKGTGVLGDTEDA